MVELGDIRKLDQNSKLSWEPSTHTDMDETNHDSDFKRKINIVASLAVLLSALFYSIQTSTTAIGEMIFVETENDRSRKRKREDELRPLMKNLFTFRDKPLVPLGPGKDRWGQMTEDTNRQYCKKLTHMYSWELESILEKCIDGIEGPRYTSWRPTPKGNSKRGRPPKFDSMNRLVFVLEWLSNGDFLYKSEMEYQYAKSSIDEDRKHILKAICIGLRDEIAWPDAAERIELKSTYNGILENVVGIFDVTEWYIGKPKDKEREHLTFSGKAGTS